MKTKITRRTKVGYAVNTSPSQGENGFYFELPTKPMWEGTLNTVGQQLSEDRYLNSLTNTFHSSAWFVKVNGTWFRAVDRDEFSWQTNGLYMEREDNWGRKSYMEDTVEVEVDYPTETARAAAQMGRTPKGDSSRENGRKGGRPRNQ